MSTNVTFPAWFYHRDGRQMLVPSADAASFLSQNWLDVPTQDGPVVMWSDAWRTMQEQAAAAPAPVFDPAKQIIPSTAEYLAAGYDATAYPVFVRRLIAEIEAAGGTIDPAFEAYREVPVETAPVAETSVVAEPVVDVAAPVAETTTDLPPAGESAQEKADDGA